MATTATTVAAVAAKARRDVVEHFMRANAVSPETAVGFVPNSRMQRRMFARWQSADVIRAAGTDRWYLDMPRYAESARRRRRFTAAGLIAAAMAAAGAMLLGH